MACFFLIVEDFEIGAAGASGLPSDSFKNTAALIGLGCNRATGRRRRKRKRGKQEGVC